MDGRMRGGGRGALGKFKVVEGGSSLKKVENHCASSSLNLLGHMNIYLTSSNLPNRPCGEDC